MVASLGLVKNHSMPALPKYELDGAYDEMFSGPGTPRSHYQALYRTLLELPPFLFVGTPPVPPHASSDSFLSASSYSERPSTLPSPPVSVLIPILPRDVEQLDDLATVDDRVRSEAPARDGVGAVVLVVPSSLVGTLAAQSATSSRGSSDGARDASLRS